MVYTMADRLLEQGEKRGIERGTEQTLTTIAISMLNDNQPIDTIAKYPGLSVEAIKQLTESVSSST